MIDEMISTEKKSDDTPYMSAYIPFANYLRRMLLPLQANGTKITVPARMYNPVEAKTMEYRGLSGVTATESEETAILDASGQTSKRGTVDWMWIQIPSKSMYMDLEKDLDEQSEFVLGSLLGKRQIEALFIGQTSVAWEKIQEYVKEFSPEERSARANFELSQFYEEKRKEILALKTARAYIDFLNEKGSTHDCNMTSSYLYNICGIKGIFYGKGGDRRILIFNAKEDITVTKMRRADI